MAVIQFWWDDSILFVFSLSLSELLHMAKTDIGSNSLSSIEKFILNISTIDSSKNTTYVLRNNEQ